MPLSDARAFAERLAQLARFHGKELDQVKVRTYWDTLRSELDDEQFAAACEALKTGDWWPTPARILRAAEVAGSFERNAAVAELYNRILACDEFGPTGGTMYRLCTIRRRCGEVAERLVRAIGGVLVLESALRRPSDEPFVRKAFIDAARDLYMTEPKTVRDLVARITGSLPTRPKALPAGGQAPGR